MSLISCPECKKQISDKAEFCPYCGLPSSYFQLSTSNETTDEIDYTNLGNILIAFDRDYCSIFSTDHYITNREKLWIKKTYGNYYITLKNEREYHNAAKLRVDIESLKCFSRKMDTLETDITTHNSNYVNATLERERDYFDHILSNIDSNIVLDDEQRRAIITDDDYCLLVAGAGAGKTTTMAAKVKYLVEKKQINPEEIIVVSYTNKAIGELRDRINKGLQIPAKICTFHTFAFDIVRKFSVEPPEINFSAYQIVFDMYLMD